MCFDILQVANTFDNIRRKLYGLCVELFEDYKRYREKSRDEVDIEKSITNLFDAEVTAEDRLTRIAGAIPEEKEIRRFTDAQITHLIWDTGAKLARFLSEELPTLEQLTKNTPGLSPYISPAIVQQVKKQLQGILVDIDLLKSNGGIGE